MIDHHATSMPLNRDYKTLVELTQPINPSDAHKQRRASVKMGTRGLFGFIIDSRRRAIYNNNDSYPDGLGYDVVSFILKVKPKDYALWIEGLRKVTWSRNQTSFKSEAWYLIEGIQKGRENLKAEDSISFLRDGIFCEWAYFIDFQNQKLEVWSTGRILAQLTFDEIIAEGKAVMKKFEGN